MLLGLLRVNVGHDALEMLDVVFAVKRAHFVHGCAMRLVDIQLLVQAVPEYKLVGHLHPQWLHGMTWAVIYRSHARVVEIANFLI